MISTKKLATIGAAAAIFATTAMPAFAHSSSINVDQSNSAWVNNTVNASSNTGYNRGSGGISTGDAATVVDVANLVNGNSATVNTCGCRGRVDVDQSNSAWVNNTVNASSNTGNNTATGHRHHHDDGLSSLGGGGGSAIQTGDAFTGVSVTNVVNANVATVGSVSE